MSHKDIIAYMNELAILKKFRRDLPYNSALLPRAKALRRAGNFPEVIFWKQVHKGKFWNIDFIDKRK